MHETVHNLKFSIKTMDAICRSLKQSRGGLIRKDNNTKVDLLTLLLILIKILDIRLILAYYKPINTILNINNLSKFASIQIVKSNFKIVRNAHVEKVKQNRENERPHLHFMVISDKYYFV